MVLCNVECLERISNYLDVSPLPLEMQENVNNIFFMKMSCFLDYNKQILLCHFIGSCCNETRIKSKNRRI